MHRVLTLLLLSLPACAVWEPIPVPAGLLALEGKSAPPPPAHAELGIEVAPNESDSLENLEQRPGVRILVVAESSPAAAAGCLVGDVLLALDGERIDDPGRLKSWLRGVVVARSAELKLERGSRVFVTSADLVVRDIATIQRTLYFVDRILTRAAYGDEDGPGGGPVIAHLNPDSPLLAAGGQVGDTVVALNGQDVGMSAEELVRWLRSELRPGASFKLGISRAGERIELAVKAWSPGRRLVKHSLWPLWYWEYDVDQDSEFLMIGDLLLISLFKRESQGSEVEYTILTFFSWKTGVATLDSNLSP
ncbi:MAG: hypothetical protein COB96_01125 [Planctomycetota bacterium]|nr:MAG: hypothetical protein COB96_01125 [Planctomycetota bacterium]